MRNTTLCYLEQNGKLLMLYRNKKQADENHGKWIGVGGKFEEGESPEECAVREVYEETGLRVKSLHLRGIVTFVMEPYTTEYMFFIHFRRLCRRIIRPRQLSRRGAALD